MKALLMLLIVSLLALPVTAQTNHTVAKPNETVWVIAYPVKADKRAQYERFIHEIFWPGASKLSAKEQMVFKQTRVLHPIEADADGLYRYLFIMDPVIKGADYGIESLIKKMYGAQKGAEYFKLFKGAVVEGKYADYRATQSKD
jgi:hypothetical protein